MSNSPTGAPPEGAASAGAAPEGAPPEGVCGADAAAESWVPESWEWSSPERDDWDVEDVVAGRVPVGAVLADCVSGRPGAGRVVMLAGVDPEMLDSEAQLDYLRALEEQLRWLQGRRVRALAAVVAADRSEERWSVIDVARLLQLSDAQAASQLAGAADLVESLPLTVGALIEGRIGLRSAEAILETSKTLRPELHGEFERGVLLRAEQQTVPGLRRSLHRAAIRLDVDSAERRRRVAYADRHVRRCGLEDGMAQFTAVLPAADVEALWRRLDAASALLPVTDTRTVDQQRADLFVDAVLSGIPFDALPELQGRRPTVGVVIGWSTLLGLDEEPADLAGYGAITAQAGREIAADASASWRRFVTDPVTGHLLDFGSTVYRPPAQLRDFILHRWPSCVHPGCGRAAYRADLDHRVSSDSGGPTSAENLFPLCRRHHRAKTVNRWKYSRDAAGVIHWTSAAGRTYVNDDTPRWRLPGEARVHRRPEPGSTLGDQRTADQAQRSAQRDRERHHQQVPLDPNAATANSDEPAGGDVTAIGDAPASEPMQRLTDYLDSLPPDVPPF